MEEVPSFANLFAIPITSLYANNNFVHFETNSINWSLNIKSVREVGLLTTCNEHAQRITHFLEH